MDAQWIKSPAGRRVLEHWADPRPSWLWSADGQTLLWRNIAGGLFHGRKGKDLGPGEAVVPIRGQIARLIRLGSINRASLSRMQFLAGDRPVSATCSCMPLQLAEGQIGLLVVDVDPIAAEFMETHPAADAATEALFPPGADYLLIDDDTQIAGGSRQALEHYAPLIESEGLPGLDAEQHGMLSADGTAVGFTRFKASPQDASLLLFDAAGTAVPTVAVKETPPAEPLLPMGLPPLAPQPLAAPAAEEHWPEHAADTATGGLTSLFDRLLDDSALFAPLRPDEDFVPPGPAAAPQAEVPQAEAAPEAAIAAASEAPIEQPVPEPTAAEAVEMPAAEAPAPVAAEPGTGTAKETVSSSPEAAEGVQPIAAEAAPAAPLMAAASELEQAASEPEPPMPVSQTAASESSGETSADPEAMPAAMSAEDSGIAAAVLYRIIGRGFTPIAAETAAPAPDAAPTVAEAAAPPAVPAYPSLDELLAELGPETAPDASAQEGATAEAPSPEVAEPTVPVGSDAEAPPAESSEAAAPDAESVERVSRYNFDELSRILNDRVGNAPGAEERPAALARPAPPSVPSATPEGALVTLGGETLVLNRLPLGILVFRDQQVLFGNRAITEMTGYDSVESLRQAGLSAIFPAAGETQEAGPVNHLVQRNGNLVPVTARLQSVSWQGKPALMLSASATEVRTGHEAAVRAFAELVAAQRSDGFIETGRSGVITQVSAEARMILRRPEELLLGRPIAQLAAPEEVGVLKAFFERPARFAETARPAVTVKAIDPSVEILLFAQGQAGVVSGYFGFLRRRESRLMPALAAPQNEADPALLERLSRGVRRPLNTVIGFSDLIGSAAFGPVDNERYLEYARDIKTAGLEIAALVDELDDFARLRDGRYTARPSDIDLAGLLDSSVTRVRGEANAARVLVRSAISERLPRIRADRASLAQAILNLLASAIAETPQDGSVVLSAQVDDAGGIAVNVRDSAPHTADLGERFVVFRDGVGRDGETLTPIHSSVGLALTRALLAVNGMMLSVDPTPGAGTLFSLTIPPDNVVMPAELPAGAS